MMQRNEDEFKMVDVLKDWVFWIGILIVLVACVIAFCQIGLGILIGGIWDSAPILLIIGGGIGCLGVYHTSIKSKRR